MYSFYKYFITLVYFQTLCLGTEVSVVTNIASWCIQMQYSRKEMLLSQGWAWSKVNLFEMYKGESSTNLMFDCEGRDGEGEGKNDSRISDLAAVYGCFIHKGSEYRRRKT